MQNLFISLQNIVAAREFVSEAEEWLKQNESKGKEAIKIALLDLRKKNRHLVEIILSQLAKKGIKIEIDEPFVYIPTMMELAEALSGKREYPKSVPHHQKTLDESKINEAILNFYDNLSINPRSEPIVFSQNMPVDPWFKKSLTLTSFITNVELMNRLLKKHPTLLEHLEQGFKTRSEPD